MQYWMLELKDALEQGFGKKNKFLGMIENVRIAAFKPANDVEELHKALSRIEHVSAIAARFANGAKEVLLFAIKEVESGRSIIRAPISAPGKDDPITMIENLLARFDKVAHQLRYRHADRPTLVINDEYDVQDLIYALLCVNFDDVRAEEFTPSYAGSSSRMDFLIKDRQIVIEVKKTRD